MPALDEVQQLLRDPDRFRRQVIFMHPEDAVALRASLPEGSFPFGIEVVETSSVSRGTVFVSSLPTQPDGTWVLPPSTIQETPKTQRRVPKPQRKGRWAIVSSKEPDED